MKAFYVIQWTIVKWLKEKGFFHYDLNGIDPETNSGTYHFKRGLADKRGRDVEFLDKFQVAGSAKSFYCQGGGKALVWV